MFPAVMVLLANWFPIAERGLLTGLALSGYMFGLLVPGISSSLICGSISIGGWPVVFYTFGGIGLIITVLQMLSLKSLPKDDPKTSRAELKFILGNQENKLTLKRPAAPWCKILRSMPTYALLFAAFGQYWQGIHFLLVHPTFLATILHYPLAENGILVSVPHLLSMILNWAVSFLSSFLSSKKYLSISKVRKFWTLMSSLIYSLCLVLMILTNAENAVTIAVSVIGIAIIAFVNNGIMIVALDMTPTFAGSLSALNSTIGGLAGFLLPVVSGVITNKEQTLEQWNKFFILSIVISMSSSIFFCIFGSAEVQRYNFALEDMSLKLEEATKQNSKAVELKDT
ncbi:putative inorganic phosphate cotransporter [Uloborus diversus]|uniref:putative inorganic phosphate cotransporter n=1 Tax=Uloborus diversus TaxID=327109 RepID=UPI00240A3E01|nr:putative inorganic phosphate cotransporter [Uloborus diversus]